jgi:hypothetical protein
LRLSIVTYLLCVAVVTAAGTGVMMLFRPAFAYSVRELLGLEAHPQAKPDSFYRVRVAPILEEHCVGCHGENRQKAKLRLDSYAAILRGGKSGPVVEPGSLRDSQLFSRITLPASNDRAMPPSSKPPLPADDVTVIKLWIARGASGQQTASAFRDAPPPVVKVTFPEVDQAAVDQARAGQSSLVQQLQKRYPGVIQYESRVSAHIEVNASLLGRSFGDADLEQLVPVANQVVWADLSGTAVTDSSVGVLVGMKNLRALRLNDVHVNDSTILALRSLHALRSLTIVGTSVNAASVVALRTTGVHVYDGNDG